jgi:hypothetical protein
MPENGDAPTLFPCHTRNGSAREQAHSDRRGGALDAGGHLRRNAQAVVFDDSARPSRPGIGDTSDPARTPAMQRAWLHFILGVSRLWLQLIRELERDGDWPRAPEARYAPIGEALDDHWRSEGGHALLHHLNAVFGYKEVQIWRRELLRF